MKNQKHPDWLTVLVSRVISEWLCHLQWTWTSYWWVLHGNLFERHSSEILGTHQCTNIHTHTCASTPTIREIERESKLITVNDGQLDAETFWSDRMDQVSAADPIWSFLHFARRCLELRCFTGKSQYFHRWYFYTVCLSGLTGQINRSNGRNN